MATIHIKIAEDEKTKIIAAIKTLQGKTVPISKIAEVAKMNPNRVRFIVEDLLEEGRIQRVPTKMFNKHYVRYRYEVSNANTISLSSTK